MDEALVGVSPDSGAVELGDRWRPGRTIGDRFLLEDEIGSGGMAMVFRARDGRTGETVALKVLFRHLAVQEIVCLRFLREIRAARELRHPNVVRIYELFDEGGVPFASMEYVDGSDLRHRLLREGRLASSAVVEIAVAAAAGLGAAHRAGIVHRDVKPQNLLLASDGTLKVVDFGLAAVDGAIGLTTRSMVLGTPEYVPPELLVSSFVDARADVYGLGVTLFECLTGTPPFRAATPYEMLRRKTEGTAPRPLDLVDGVDPRLDEAIVRAMARDPEDRFPSMEALRAFLTGDAGVIVPIASDPVGPCHGCGAPRADGVAICPECGEPEEPPAAGAYYLVLDDASLDTESLEALVRRLSESAEEDPATLRRRLDGRLRSLPTMLAGPLAPGAAAAPRARLEEVRASISIREESEAIDDLLTRGAQLGIVTAFAALVVGLLVGANALWGPGTGVLASFLGIAAVGVFRRRIYRWFARRLPALVRLRRVRGAPPLPVEFVADYRALVQGMENRRLRAICSRTLRRASTLLARIDTAPVPIEDREALRRDVEHLLTALVARAGEAWTITESLDRENPARLFERLEALRRLAEGATDGERRAELLEEADRLRDRLDRRTELEHRRDRLVGGLLQMAGHFDELAVRLAGAVADRSAPEVEAVSRILGDLRIELDATTSALEEDGS